MGTETAKVEANQLTTNQPANTQAATIAAYEDYTVGHQIQMLQSGRLAPGQFQKTVFNLQRTIGNRAVVQLLSQQQNTTTVHEAAAKGVEGSGSKLPHYEKIQSSFGRHNIANVQAYTGGQAAAANQSIGAQAYATGNKVAFSDSNPDLFTAAHEATHIIQQRAGVQLKGGVGKEGDPYEQHADQVARQVVQGKSAENLLDQYASASSSNTSLVQGYGLTPVQMVATHSGKGTITYVPASSPTVITDATGGTTQASEVEADKAEVNNIDPADYGSGTRTNSAVRTTSQAAQALLGDSWVAGHLLNHYLGGTGQSYDNITAFTKKTNSDHLHKLETPAKNEVAINKKSISYYTMVTKRKTIKNAAGVAVASNLASELEGGYGIPGAPTYKSVTFAASFPLLPRGWTAADAATGASPPGKSSGKTMTESEEFQISAIYGGFRNFIEEKGKATGPFTSSVSGNVIANKNDVEDEAEELYDYYLRVDPGTLSKFIKLAGQGKYEDWAALIKKDLAAKGY